MRAFTLIVASALAAFVNAQSSTTSAASSASATPSTTAAPTTSAAAGPVTQSQSMPPSATAAFNINNVTSSEKTNWCRAQRNSCREVCGGGPARNDCADDLLTYACTCYNGTVPDLTRYTETLPYFICIATRDQCVAAHPDDRDGQENCMALAQCGTIEPPEEESTSDSSSGSGTATTSGASSTSATTSTPNAAMIYNTDATTGAFAALLMAVFEFLL